MAKKKGNDRSQESGVRSQETEEKENDGSQESGVSIQETEEKENDGSQESGVRSQKKKKMMGVRSQESGVRSQESEEGEVQEIQLPFEKWKVKEKNQGDVKVAFHASGLKSPDEVYALKVYINPHPKDIMIISRAGKKHTWCRLEL